jgi:hypothetical protein
MSCEPPGEKEFYEINPTLISSDVLTSPTDQSTTVLVTLFDSLAA